MPSRLDLGHYSDALQRVAPLREQLELLDGEPQDARFVSSDTALVASLKVEQRRRMQLEQQVAPG